MFVDFYIIIIIETCSLQGASGPSVVTGCLVILFFESICVLLGIVGVLFGYWYHLIVGVIWSVLQYV